MKKTNNKALAILFLSLLLISSCGIALNFVPVTKADTEYVTMTIFYAPSDMAPPPELIPAVGPHSYPKGSQINITAPLLVTGTVEGTRYVFKNWMTTYTESGNFYGNNSANSFLTMPQNDNYTYTACYKTQYLVTLGSNLVGATDWIWNGTWHNTNSLWVDAGTQAKVGVEGLSILVGPKPGIWTDPYHRWAYCDSFDGDFKGYNTNGVDNAYSNLTMVNGPKAGTSIWAFYYALYVSPNSTAPAEGYPPGPIPPGQDYYTAGTNVTLTAPVYNPGGGRRWILNYWTVDSVSRGVGVNPITVLMNWNHTAIAYYKRQSFVYLANSTIPGVYDAGKWYDDGKLYKFTAPTIIPVGPGVQYGWYCWWKEGYGWTNSSLPLWKAFDASWDGEKLRACYYTQYYMVVTSKGSIVPDFLYPDSDKTGWYNAWSWIHLKARPVVPPVPTTSKEVFDQWRDHLGGTYPTGNLTFQIYQPVNMTAEYHLEWKYEWKQSPSTISVAGFPGSWWAVNGSLLNWWAPSTDLSTNFVFYYWVIDGITRAQGQQTVPILHDHYIVGTAYYVNKTKVYMDPDWHVETAHAYCNKFNVTIYASNFNASRLDPSGAPMDIYGFDIIINFPANLIEVQDYYTNLKEFFKPNDYFPKPDGMIKINNTAGTFQIVATVKGNSSGFSGTKWIFKLTFHVKYDPCYPTSLTYQPIYFQKCKLVNHLDQQISPEQGPYGCWYHIITVQPWLEVRNAADWKNRVQVDKNVPQTFFDVEVYLHNGVKVSDFYVVVSFDESQIMAVSVTIADYLKPPFAIYHKDIDNVNGYVTVYVAQEAQVPYQNCSGLLFTIRFKVVNQIWYRITGPLYTLESDIAIHFGELSVHCPTLVYQDTLPYNGYLGSKSCHYVYNPLPGDLDYDGWVTVLDLQLILDNYCKWMPLGYDVTGDSHTDIMDLVFVALRFNNHI